MESGFEPRFSRFFYFDLYHQLPTSLPLACQSGEAYTGCNSISVAYLITGSTTAETYRLLVTGPTSSRRLESSPQIAVRTNFEGKNLESTSEPESAWTYVLNNILFSRAEDPIGAYEHLGGTAAARAIASKDLYSIKHLNQLDVPGIYTMGSAVIDYHGKRWIAQGMIPGIFRPPDLEAEKAQQDLAVQQSQINGQSTHDDKDEGDWEKVNGADIGEPEMGLRSDPKFHRLASHVASGFNLNEHDVTDVNGRVHRLWLSADVHGIRATDGRCYLIDLYRMNPLDVYFIQNDINGPILDGKTPIRSARPKRQSSFGGGLGEEVVVDPDTLADDSSDALDKESFEFALNPDAFVDRKDQPWTIPEDEEDESMALVKELSKYVREQLLPSVVQDLSEVKGLPADGRRLSDLLHSHGVNIRYLGHITHRLQLAANSLSASPENKDDQNVVLQASIGLLQSEMVFRACKHILNQMLLTTSESEACPCISHFLNCLLGQSAAIPSSEPCLDQSSAWRTCTRQSLRSQITSAIRRHFRYALPSSFLLSDSLAPRSKCRQRAGPEKCRDFTNHRRPAPATNGQTNSTDDENSTEGATPNESSAPSAPKNIKKKKKSKSKKGAASPSASVDGQTFSPNDILNLLPIVRDSTCRSSVADELYAEGRKAFSNGDIALGQELCTDALTTYEQVLAQSTQKCAVIGTHWRFFTISSLSEPWSSFPNTNDRLLELSAFYHAASNEDDREKLKQRIESYQRDREPEAVKNEIDTYIQLAANNLRQSVIVAERVLGLDHPETIQQYSDLSVMEYHLGNTDTAMRYTNHALEPLAFGTHAGVLAQSTLDPSNHHALILSSHSPDRWLGAFSELILEKFAEATLILSQMFAQGGQKEQAIKYGLETKRCTPANTEKIMSKLNMPIRYTNPSRLGLDPKRAATLRARLLASSASPTGSSAEWTLSRRTGPDEPLIAPKNLCPRKFALQLQMGPSLSIDDLVD
ncbi:hypothetical protein H4Q26_008959 [Puccinia striiformis f. sp. tritici PST-130]|nr:hypothetical protein H4Q26_008959 [Puccinia striiformis f. sp. tritici PST-130]